MIPGLKKKKPLVSKQLFSEAFQTYNLSIVYCISTKNNKVKKLTQWQSRESQTPVPPQKH